MTELERLDQAAEYFRRFDEMEAAITQNRENQDYLKTYIHEEDYVLRNFDLNQKRLKSIGISCGAGVVLFLLLFIIIRGSVGALVGGVLGALVAAGGSIVLVSMHHYRLDAAKKEQREINEGITEQIEILKAREPQLIQAKENYYKGLTERIPFMALEDRMYIPDMKKMIEDGEAATVEEANVLLEQKLLMAQFNSIMENTEIEKVYTEEENKQRFGDPLELIGKKKKPLFGGFGKKKK